MANVIWGHGNCPRIPHISNYEQAKAHYEGVKPIRGRTVECRPLGKERRYDWYQIKQNTYANQSENREYYTYCAHLYKTDVVEFYPNGDVTLRTGGWQSFTTGACINFVIGKLGHVMSESGKWYLRTTQGEVYRWEGRELKLKLNEHGHLVLKDAPVQEYKKTINRKAMNAMRKKYKAIRDYGVGMLSMDSKVENVEPLELSKYGMDSFSYRHHYSWQAERTINSRNAWFKVADSYLESGDLDTLYFLARCVASNAGRYSYKVGGHVCQPQDYLATFDELIKHHFRDEVFNSEPVPVGVMFNDRNKKYFN
jgi:hypothetical protein